MHRFVVACVAVVLAGVLAALAPGGSGTAIAGRWVIRDLGTAGGTASSAIDINERGEVVGWIYTARSRAETPSRHAFLWSQGRMRDLGTLPLGGGGDIPNASAATAINDRGQVIGTSSREQTGATPHVFVWFKGAMRAVGCGRAAPARCGVASTAAGLNERGQVVGSISVSLSSESEFGFGVTVAFFWQNGTLTRLGVLPGRSYSRARDLNDRGDVVGASYAHEDLGEEVRTRAFLWHEGKMTDLGALPGSNMSEAVAINERGQIVGNSSGAFLWHNGKMTALGTLPGEQSSAAAGINDRGLVIGSSGSMFANDRGDTVGNRESAFLWQNGTMTNLGVLPGDNRSSAVAINNRGQIVGVSYDGTPQTAFVWQAGKMTRLPKLPRGGMSAPTAINDRGEIVGWCGGRRGEDRHEEHAVLWTWQPAK
jgi:probable HAF family extracellular repeat protein